MSQKIEVGQTGAVVRDILNKQIDKISDVAEDVNNTIPLTNTEIAEILK